MFLRYSQGVLKEFEGCSNDDIGVKLMQATDSVEAEAEPDVDPDVDPDPEQYPPLFFFKSTYWPSGISSIWKNIYIVSKLYWVFTHLNLNSARVRNNPKGVAGPQCKTAGLAEHVILTPWREMMV